MKTLKTTKLAGTCAAALFTGGLLLHVSPVIAATAAGTQIKNLATVTYEDEGGNTYSAQSNEAIITVKQVYSAEISSDTTKTAAAGQVVYSQHTLTNTGNGEDTYTLAVADVTGDDLNASSPIKVYVDENGNGLVDAGEQEVTSITLAAGETVELVMAVAVPNTASAGEDLGAKLTATTSNGAVTDISSGKGVDALDGTNHTWITVSSDAVLNYTKSAVLNPTTHQITYTLTVSNTGNQTATDVKIYDAVPAGMTYVSSSASGLLAANGDTLPVNQSIDEAPGMDLNKDGDTTDTGLNGIYAVDAALASGATISLSFIASYDPATFNNNAIPGSAGDIVKNTGFLTADTDGAPGGTPVVVPSNPTQTTLPQIFDVQSVDTGENTADAVNDGKDDNAADDVQTVNSAPSGSVVLFSVEVTNTGTGRDTFELTTSGSTFPAGTVFTYWNADGTVQLVDTNAEGGLDTGMLESGATTTIMVKAQLPAGATSGGTAVVTATSANDPSATPQKDTTTLQLLSVSAPGVDLYDDKTKAGSSSNEDDLGASPYDINNGAIAGTRVALTGTVGGTVNIPLYVDNGSGSADSFQLSLGSVWNGTSMGALPTGWSVLFYKGDGSGNPTGSPITSTALLPAMTTGHEYVAVVTIPNDPAYALADYVADNNGTPASLETLDANSDGDGDQPIFIRITSALSGASDIMVDAIDVTSLAQVTLTPPGNNQIQPGGSVDYSNTLENTGNTAETLELAATDSLSADNWGNTVKVDTNGDGVPDKTLAELAPGDVIKGVDTEGNPVNIEVTDADGDNKPEVTLLPGEKFDLTPTVFAPSNAAPGATDVLTITATNTDPTGPSTTVDDTSTVILGQVRLQKTVAYDAACDGTADGAFAANLTAKVAPTECAIWQIQAENQGDALAKNVVIRDTVPAYSTYEIGSLTYCLDNACISTPASVTDGIGNDEGEISGTAISFYVGANAVPATAKGGELQPGQIATVRFSSKVD